jgi:nuclear RNA export factor
LLPRLPTQIRNRLQRHSTTATKPSFITTTFPPTYLTPLPPILVNHHQLPASPRASADGSDPFFYPQTGSLALVAKAYAPRFREGRTEETQRRYRHDLSRRTAAVDAGPPSAFKQSRATPLASRGGAVSYQVRKPHSLGPSLQSVQRCDSAGRYATSERQLITTNNLVDIMAPRGPRGQTAATGGETRTAAPSSKASSRGGIQKRRGQVRVDNDGDLDMDSTTARRTSGRTDSSKGRAGSKASNPRGASRTAQTMLKHLSNGDSSRLASRVTNPNAAKAVRSRVQNSTPLMFLRVHGLKESKAASNPDGGLSDLLSFLERKSSSFLTGRSKRQIRIKKVC